MKKLIIPAALAMTMLSCTTRENPLLTTPKNEYGVVEFSQVQLSDYKPAFEAAIAEYNAEIDAIVNCPDAPTFQNTVAALDRSGLPLERVQGVFYNLLETEGDDEMYKLAEELSPMVTEVSDNILLNEGLFQRIKAVHDTRMEANLTPEQLRLTEVIYRQFAQNGANLDPAAKERLKEINKELASLSPLGVIYSHMVEPLGATCSVGVPLLQRHVLALRALGQRLRADVCIAHQRHG